MLFALSLGVLMSIFDRAPESITGGTVRKTLSWISGRGFSDSVPRADEMRESMGMAPVTTTSTTSEGYSWSSAASGEGAGSVVLGEGGSEEGESVGEGVRVLEEELTKSPIEM